MPLGETEIEDLGPGCGKHHVGRFQIAMGQSMAMGGVERIGELRPNPQRVLERQRAPQQTVRKRLAGQVLHHQEIDTVLFPDVMERADVRVRQARIARASRRNRAWRCGLATMSGGRTLIATARSSRVSRAR